MFLKKRDSITAKNQVTAKLKKREQRGGVGREDEVGATGGEAVRGGPVPSTAEVAAASARRSRGAGRRMGGGQMESRAAAGAQRSRGTKGMMGGGRGDELNQIWRRWRGEVGGAGVAAAGQSSKGETSPVHVAWGASGRQGRTRAIIANDVGSQFGTTNNRL
jgi:hypothetical protein